MDKGRKMRKIWDSGETERMKKKREVRRKWARRYDREIW